VIVRRLVIRLTLIASLLAGLAATVLGLATGTQPHVVMFRALLAFTIVLLAGAGVGLVVMRTALRRYYEQGRRPGRLQANPMSTNRPVPMDRHVPTDR
jgi:branched-subunit amino acid ABC-type transport system permease component